MSSSMPTEVACSIAFPVHGSDSAKVPSHRSRGPLNPESPSHLLKGSGLAAHEVALRLRVCTSTGRLSDLLPDMGGLIRVLVSGLATPSCSDEQITPALSRIHEAKLKTAHVAFNAFSASAFTDASSSGGAVCTSEYCQAVICHKE